jgi:hypothetical protein
MTEWKPKYQVLDAGSQEYLPRAPICERTGAELA